MARHLKVLDQAVMEATRGVGSKRLLVSMPPRHGKSEFLSKWTPAWWIAKNPDHRVLLASYESKFAAWWGGKARTAIEENEGQLRLRLKRDSRSKSNWEVYGRTGGMNTAGVGGAFTGRGANLLIVDDPIKNAEEAMSPVIRQSLWDWWLSTAYTRIEPNGVAIVIATRWHEDDLIGRIRAADDKENPVWRSIVFPAIAEGDDELGRKNGDPLWPERYDIKALTEIRKSVFSRVWASLYQQRPVPAEGAMFKREWFDKRVRVVPAECKRAVRAWDKAGTQGNGDYSAGVLITEYFGTYYVVNVTRDQWSSRARNTVIKQCACDDSMQFDKLEIWAEQEPGSGGKESAEFTIRDLAGYNVRAERVTGDKTTRAQNFAAQCEGRNVVLVEGPWNREFIEELCTFPNGTHDDQVDAASLAFNKLARKKAAFSIGTA